MDLLGLSPARAPGAPDINERYAAHRPSAWWQSNRSAPFFTARRPCAPKTRALTRVGAPPEESELKPGLRFQDSAGRGRRDRLRRAVTATKQPARSPARAAISTAIRARREAKGTEMCRTTGRFRQILSGQICLETARAFRLPTIQTTRCYNIAHARAPSRDRFEVHAIGRPSKTQDSSSALLL